jgi:homoserine kinase
VRVTVRVPATSANLGPGFDCFGLALDLCNEVTIDTEATPGVTWEGEGVDELPTDGSDLVHRAMQHALECQRVHHPGAGLPTFAMHAVNRIPLERGLGSSSAATVAGVAIANVLLGDAGWEDDLSTTYGYAAEVEGHPDNVGAATYGGFTVIADGYVRRLDLSPDLRPVVLIPEGMRLPTSDARASLPSMIGREDAVFNAAHAALMVEALTRDPSLLLVAMRDRLHQAARLALVPPVGEVFDTIRASDIPVCVSGAGPSLLAFEIDGREVPHPGAGWTALRPGVRAAGFEILAED